MDSVVSVGVLGCGHVGGALLRQIEEGADVIAARTGLRLDVRAVAVRSLAKERSVTFDPGVLTTDAASVVADPGIDVVVEAIGGIEPARTLILDALSHGKPVVTGNKELLANMGDELFSAAHEAGVDLLFEAAVGGGIPLIRPLRESLAGEQVQRVMGIVNGTTNYVLTRMAEDGSSFEEALAEAQTLGYAERDPTADIEGFDAAAKAAILARVAFGVQVVAGDVYREGISEVTSADIDFARRLGYVVKLLVIAEAADGDVAVRVHPAMVPLGHPLAFVRDSFNAVFVEGRSVGDVMLYGRGAGGMPSASAVLGDLLDAAANLRRGTHGGLPEPAKARIRPIDELLSQYYLNLDVADRPGVLHAVSAVFGPNNVSIRSMEQVGLGDEARIIFITHSARERDVQAALHQLRELEVVDRIGSLMRVVGPE